MASTPEQIERFERNIPKVTTCCLFFDLNFGGHLISAFGIVAGVLYIAQSLSVLFDVNKHEESQESDDFLNDDDDAIWLTYISQLFVGLTLMITSIYMFFGSAKATSTVYRQQYLCSQRMACHVFPFLVGILLSTFWSTLLGIIEVLDSDVTAVIYFALAVLQIYFWLVAVSLFNQLLEVEQNPQKPTCTNV